MRLGAFEVVVHGKTGIGIRHGLLTARTCQRQILRTDDFAGGKCEGALDDVLQFANVPEPGVSHERGHGRSRERPLRHARLEQAVRELGHEQRDVVETFAKGRQRHLDHIDAVVKVFAEGSLAHHLHQVAVGGGHDPDLDRSLLGAAHPPHSAFLDHAQELDLHSEGHFRNLVQKKRALMRLFENSLARLAGIGERPFHMSE